LVILVVGWRFFALRRGRLGPFSGFEPVLQAGFFALVFGLVEASDTDFCGQVLLIDPGIGIGVGVFVAFAVVSFLYKGVFSVWVVNDRDA
jgi:hypothetical protein